MINFWQRPQWLLIPQVSLFQKRGKARGELELVESLHQASQSNPQDPDVGYVMRPPGFQDTDSAVDDFHLMQHLYVRC